MRIYKAAIIGLGTSGLAVNKLIYGFKEDEIILTPLEKAIKGKSEINKDLVRVSEILSL